jgi:peptidoglycan/xylan/chitin deacetylase (PgdA/CDA1 family)
MKKVLLSFDIEEFDMPMEYGKSISFEEQIAVSVEGTKIILDSLRDHQIPATFFSTVAFATHAPELIARIKNENHELASHGYFHSTFKTQHLLESRIELERITGNPVSGFRMPRMMPVDEVEIQQAGYLYNSSLNPVYLPGRYNNFFKPRTLFNVQGLWHLPASATPLIRFPLFWLSFHNAPLWVYKTACKRTISRDNYLNLYFHPWEFTDLNRVGYGLPRYVSRNSGSEMVNRFCALLTWMKEQGYTFSTIIKFLEPHLTSSIH